MALAGDILCVGLRYAATRIMYYSPRHERNRIFPTAIGRLRLFGSTLCRVTSKLSPRDRCEFIRRPHALLIRMRIDRQSHNFSTLTKGASCRRSCAAAATAATSPILLFSHFTIDESTSSNCDLVSSRAHNGLPLNAMDFIYYYIDIDTIGFDNYYFLWEFCFGAN